MNESQSKLRETIAAHHGLDHRAARLLVGSTIEELEASAVTLAMLIEERKDEEPRSASTATTDLFASARAGKAERQQALVDAITGRASQARDERGRFVSTSFDGGARTPAPRPGPTHDEWLADVLRNRRADVGASF
jgi:hypothetical protein